MISARARITALCALLGALLVSMLVAACVGAFELSVGTIVALVLERIAGPGASPEGSAGAVARDVFWVIRAPRVVLAALVGAALGLLGAALQGVFRNPLADPGLLGVSSGAALGVVAVLVFGVVVPGLSGPWLVPMAAFVGAMGVTVCVLELATRRGQVDMTTMLLAGVAVNALAGAVIGFATYAASDAELRSLTMWSLGSLGNTGWVEVAWVAALSLPCVLVVLRGARRLDLLLLGEREAVHLGVDVARTRRVMVVCCALMVGASVGFTGIIGFVGLVVPHLARLSGGARHAWVLPASTLGGAALLVCADTLARTLAAPAELPIGVLTAMVGAPFFLGLLLRERARGAQW